MSIAALPEEARVLVGTVEGVSRGEGHLCLHLAALALTSGFAAGYNGTMLEGVVPRLQFLGLMVEPFELGMLEGAMSLGGLIGSLVCAELSSSISRRALVLVGESTIASGVLCFAILNPATAPVLYALVGRLTLGMGIGVCGLAKPLIVSELAPPLRRGLLVGFFSVGQSIGLNCFYWLDLLMPPPPAAPWAWRVLVAIGAMPAVATILLVSVFRGSPEYWDVAPRKRGAAADGDRAPRVLHHMLCEEQPEIRRNFGLILALTTGYNLSGTLVITNYASDILSDSTRRLPIIIGLVQLLGLISGSVITDRIGRRPLLLVSCFVTTTSLISLSLLLASTTREALDPSRNPVTLWSLVLLMVTVEFAVGAGLNPGRLLLSAELMPNAYRGVGMSLGSAMGWMIALLSLFWYPIIAAAGGPAPQFAFFGCVVGALFLLLAWQLPETKGISFSAGLL